MAIDKVTSAALETSTNQPGFRNLVINGDMSIAQRGTSQTSAGSSSGSYQTIDRFKFFNINLGAFTQSQSTDVPTGQGFAKSMKMDCTTADASPAAADALFLSQFVEGQNLQYLKYGTSSAESLTVSVFANDNGSSLQCNFWLGAGTNYTSGTLATSWQTYDATDRAVGQVNLADSTSNEWYVTGLQVEVGTAASDFEFLPTDVNLKRCERYFYTTADWQGGYYLGATTDPSEQGALCVVNLSTSDRNGIGIRFPNRMRAAPTITFFARGSNTSGTVSAAGSNQTAAGGQISPVGTGFIDVTSGSVSEVTNICYAYKIDAEL
jgi:hypothetical protein